MGTGATTPRATSSPMTRPDCRVADREAFKRTSYAPSLERLIKRVLAGGSLPEIDALVDLYNLVSLESGLCLGCDDLDRTTGNLAYRFARLADSFLDMGADAGEDPNDPPKPGEVVYADDAHVLCRRWNWRQDARSVTSLATRRAVLAAQSNGVGSVEAAAGRLARLIERECGRKCGIVVLDRNRRQGHFCRRIIGAKTKDPEP